MGDQSTAVMNRNNPGTFYADKVVGGGQALTGTPAYQFDVTAAPFGAKGDGISDDTAAIQGAINAAVKYAAANSGYAEVLVPPAPAYYAINGPLQTGSPTFGNSQLTLPVVSATANKITLVIRGGATGASGAHWQQTTWQKTGATLVSNGVFANAGAQGSSITANGNPSLLGGPAQPAGYGTSALTFSNMNVVLQGLTLVNTYSASGLSYCGADFSGVAQASVYDCNITVTGTFASGQFNTPNGFATGLSKGLIMPAAGNNDICEIRNLSVWGGYTYALLATEHTVTHNARLLYCWSAFCPVGNYFGSVGALHGIWADQISSEGCINNVYVLGQGQSGIGPFVDICQLDTESAAPTFADDGNSGIQFSLGTINLRGQYTLGSISIGRTGLKLLNGQQAPGYVANPSYTLGTAFRNPWFRDATITITGGTVTGVKVGQWLTGGTAPTMQATGMTSGTFRLPSLGWLEIDGSVAPTMTVVLD